MNSRGCESACGRGFTLAELVVVVMVLAALAGVGAVAYGGAARRSANAAAATSASAMASAVQARAAESDASAADVVAALWATTRSTTGLLSALGVTTDASVSYRPASDGLAGSLAVASGNRADGSYVTLPTDAGTPPTITELPSGTASYWQWQMLAPESIYLPRSGISSNDSFPSSAQATAPGYTTVGASTGTVAGSSPGIFGRQIPVSPGQAYTGAGFATTSVAGSVIARIEWYNTAGSLLSVSSGQAAATGPTNAAATSVTATAPTGAATGVVTLYGNKLPLGTTWTMWGLGFGQDVPDDPALWAPPEKQ